MPRKFHIYFMAGICDLTEKVRDLAWVKDYKGCIIQAPYEEVIFIESWKDTPAIFIDELTEFCDEIIELRAKPSIMTIPTISIQNWNETRLNQYKTCHLLHHQQYPDMQENLNKTLWEVNLLIIGKNIGNKMFTPKIASSIMVNQGPNKPPGRQEDRKTLQRRPATCCSCVGESDTDAPALRGQEVADRRCTNRPCPCLKDHIEDKNW